MDKKREDSKSEMKKEISTVITEIQKIIMD
jgi:hypothetical protein